MQTIVKLLGGMQMQIIVKLLWGCSQIIGEIYHPQPPCFSTPVCIQVTLHFNACILSSMHVFNSITCNACCCCSAYLSSCHRTASDANLLDNPHTFNYQDYFVIGGVRTCLGVSVDPMFLWISSNSCPLNLLLVYSIQCMHIQSQY